MTDITLCDGRRHSQPRREDCADCLRATLQPDPAYQSWSDFWNTDDFFCTHRLVRKDDNDAGQR